MTGEGFIPEHLILPSAIIPLCEDQKLRTAVLVTLPTLDDIGLAPRQLGGDPDHGVQIPGVSGDRTQSGVASSGSSDKGKQAMDSASAPTGSSRAIEEEGIAGCAAVTNHSSGNPPRSARGLRRSRAKAAPGHTAPGCPLVLQVRRRRHRWGTV